MSGRRPRLHYVEAPARPVSSSRGEPRPYALVVVENRALLSHIGRPLLAAKCNLILARHCWQGSRYLSRLKPRYVAIEIETLRSESYRFLKALPDRAARDFRLIVAVRHPLLRAVVEAAGADCIVTCGGRPEALAARIRELCLADAG